MASIVRLRTSEGHVFEVSDAIAGLLPVIAQLLDCDCDDEEVPLPSVGTATLGLVIDQCKCFLRLGSWDPDGLGKCVADFEHLYWAADYLGLEELQFLCHGKLTHALREQGPVKVTCSARFLRRALADFSGHPKEKDAVLVDLMRAGPEFFRAIWIDEIVVEGLEIRPLGLDSIEFDEAGEMEIGFIALKPGSYHLKVPGSTGETQRLEITIR